MTTTWRHGKNLWARRWAVTELTGGRSFTIDNPNDLWMWPRKSALNYAISMYLI